MKNTNITIDVDGAKQIADFILVQDYEMVAQRVSKKEFNRIKRKAKVLKEKLNELGDSVREFPREVKTRLKQCLAAIAKFVSGKARVEEVEDLILQLCGPS